MYPALNHIMAHRLAVCDSPRASKGQHLQNTHGGEGQRAVKEPRRGISPSRDNKKENMVPDGQAYNSNTNILYVLSKKIWNAYYIFSYHGSLYSVPISPRQIGPDMLLYKAIWFLVVNIYRYMFCI